MKRLITVLLLFASFSLGSAASAHESLPVYLGLSEAAPGDFDVTWRIPATQGAAPGVAPDFPSWCHSLLEPVVAPGPGTLQGRVTIRCGARGLANGRITLVGLDRTVLDALVRISFADGAELTEVLHPDKPSLTLAGPRARIDVGGYFRLGVEHILLGVDHLLFVTGLVLIVRRLGRLVKTITAFTVAHSLTLALATLGVVHVPPAPVEATIALSILFLARELVRAERGDVGLTARQPWLVAFAFGLLHGLGFAGALAQIGLPQHDIPLALLLFNLGVEAGQLMFVAVLLALGATLARLAGPLPRWAARAPTYAIGVAAAFWLIQRTAAIF
jgi:hydrogenase/urease accessory protein HupE